MRTWQVKLYAKLSPCWTSKSDPFNHIIVFIIKNARNSKIFESEKGELRSLIVKAQKNQGGFSQPYLGDEK